MYKEKNYIIKNSKGNKPNLKYLRRVLILHIKKNLIYSPTGTKKKKKNWTASNYNVPSEFKMFIIVT